MSSKDGLLLSSFSINSIQAFRNTAFTSLSFTEGLQTIGNYAFSDCTKLKDIVLPATLTSIGTQAFDDYSSSNNNVLLNTIKFKGTTPPTMSSSPFGINKSTTTSCKIYVPSSAYSAYVTALKDKNVVGSQYIVSY